MKFTRDQESEIVNLINKGEKFHVISKKIGSGCSSQDIQAFCWQTGEMSWQGSKKMISSRLKKLPTATTRQDREELVGEITERVNYLYNCAKDMKDRLNAFEKAAKKLIEIH